MNLLCLTIFPAVVSPNIQTMGDMKIVVYERLIFSRQAQLADWVLFTLKYGDDSKLSYAIT